MPRTVLTSKGQMTVPQEVRATLGLEMGDQLLIETTETGFQATVIRRSKAADLQGVLRGPVEYAGKEAEAQAVAEALASKHRR
jgi:antitoxin PrlF